MKNHLPTDELLCAAKRLDIQQQGEGIAITNPDFGVKLDGPSELLTVL